MNHVLIQGGVVVMSDRTPYDLEDAEALLQPADGYIPAPEHVVPGFLYDGTVFSEPAPPAPRAPDIISDRQFFQALAGRSIITEAEALAAVKTGSVPDAMQAMVDALRPEADRFAADMLLSGATSFNRTHPLTAVFGAAFGWNDAEIDTFWIEAEAL